MAWKLRKDKLKAGAPEAETPAETAATPVTATMETEQAPAFDLSGSAFQPQPVAAPDEEPEIPSFLDDIQPIALVSKPESTQEPEPIDLEPLPATHPREESPAEAAFLAEPLPESDSMLVPDFQTEPEAIAISPPVFSPDLETVAQPAAHAEDTVVHPEITPEREAIAAGLVTTETETGLPKVAPFILDTPAAVTKPEPPRMHSVVIRIGKLSATHFLTKDVTTIGRPDSLVQNYPDIEIELDDGISRRHAEIRRDEMGYRLTDVGSTNGTALNGETLTPHQPALLQPGDRIRLGEITELLFE